MIFYSHDVFAIRNCGNVTTFPVYVREWSAELGNDTWSLQAFCDVALGITGPHATQTFFIQGFLREMPMSLSFCRYKLAQGMGVSCLNRDWSFPERLKTCLYIAAALLVSHQWRTEGVWGVQTPPPKFRRPSKKSYQTQPDCENC